MRGDKKCKVGLGENIEKKNEEQEVTLIVMQR